MLVGETLSIPLHIHLPRAVFRVQYLGHPAGNIGDLETTVSPLPDQKAETSQMLEVHLVLSLHVCDYFRACLREDSVRRCHTIGGNATNG